MIRTEEEILKDFAELGWFVVKDKYVDLILKNLKKEPDDTLGEICHHCYISINKENHTYSACDLHCLTKHEYELTMQEHKLLHELFICWGWLENGI